MNAKHSSEHAEHYSPAWLAELACVLMGGIDVDPASSGKANRVIGARKYYTKATNGYNKPWPGRVFLNPPGGICEAETGKLLIKKTKDRESCTVTGSCGRRAPHVHQGVTSSAKAWWHQLGTRYLRGETRSALFIGFSLEILQSTQIEMPFGHPTPVRPAHFPRLYPKDRVPFYSMKDGKLVEGTDPTHANVIVYLPALWSSEEEERFESFAGRYGDVTWPRRPVDR